MSDNPQGRLDIFFQRLAKAACERIHQRTGVDMWPHASPVVEELIDHHDIRGKRINIGQTVARNVLGVLPRKQRRRGIGARNYRRAS